jgi:hypothetical protein
MIIFKWPILILIQIFGVGLEQCIAKGTHVILGEIQSENWPKTLLKPYSVLTLKNICPIATLLLVRKMLI